MTHLILSIHDVAPRWHERYPGIMKRFVASFDEPVIVWENQYHGLACGRIVSVETCEAGLCGKVQWVGEPLDGYVRASWAFGPGTERVSISSAHVDPYPPRESYDDDGWDYECAL